MAPFRLRLRLPPKSLLIWISLAFASVGASAIYSIGVGGRQLPDLTTKDIGTPFRATSSTGLKAARGFEAVDEQKTKVLRDEARTRARPVYDYSQKGEQASRAEVQRAFEWLRDFGYPLRPKSRDLARLSQAIREERSQHPELAVIPEDTDELAALAGTRFSSDVQSVALDLLDSVYTSKIIATRDELARAGPNGITIRSLDEGEESSLTNQKSQAVLDLHEASQELDRSKLPQLMKLPPTLRRAVIRIAKRALQPTLTVNTAETEARRRMASEEVKPVTIVVKRGQRIIGDGELITETHLLLLQSLRTQLDDFDVLQQKFGVAVVAALILAAAWLFFRTAFRRFQPSATDALFMAGLAVALLAGLQCCVLVAEALHDRYPQLPVELMYYAFPGLAGAMLVRFLVGAECALYFAVVFSALAGMILGNSLSYSLFTLVGSLAASDQVGRVKVRADFFRSGLRVGLGVAALLIAMSLASGKTLMGELFGTTLGGFFGATIAAPMLVLTITPLMEMLFGYASDLKLLELANLNHPALKELVLQAPGTYHHSIIMGTLVEAAAEAIGANPLLARSCAYYHDIGKGRNPLYFGENQKGQNPHDRLEPLASATIIKRHVTDGLEMAKQYKLPIKVADAIPQHHGTRLVGYFAHKHRSEAEARGVKLSDDDTRFRYPGPIPQFREAALVMIADACEAASRSMKDPTADELRVLVRKMITVIFSEGQLDECDLNLRDLNLIGDAFVHALTGIYHNRPVYPPAAVSGVEPVPILRALHGREGDGRAAK